MDYKKEKELIEKYLAGNCTEAEQEKLELWYLMHTEEVQDHLAEPDYKGAKSKIWQGITLENKPVKRLFPFQRIAIAASLFLCSALGLYLFLNKAEIARPPSQLVADQINPGKDVAVLTLANGRNIDLSGVKAGQIVADSGVTITKTGDGQLVYHTDQSVSVTDAMNIVSTPAGGQYQIYLPDGTRVWLNAASSLKYPSSFSKLKDRSVELNGEAYFEVAKNKEQPFIVTTAQQKITVLGTHFNVMAYRDEAVLKTTLIEGSVKVSLNTDHFKILSPGQQAEVFNAPSPSGTSILVSKADLEAAVAWKDGYFKFNESLQEIMRKISRWYNVEIVYSSGIDLKQGFGGKISRSKSIDDVLKIMESTGNVHFKIEGRRIMVMN